MTSSLRHLIECWIEWTYVQRLILVVGPYLQGQHSEFALGRFLELSTANKHFEKIEKKLGQIIEPVLQSLFKVNVSARRKGECSITVSTVVPQYCSKSLYLLILDAIKSY